MPTTWDCYLPKYELCRNDFFCLISLVQMLRCHGVACSQDPRSNFERGQCVRCSILSAKEGEKKLQLSLVGEPKNTASQATGESTTFSLGSFVRGKAVGFPQSGEIKVELEGAF